MSSVGRSGKIAFIMLVVLLVAVGACSPETPGSVENGNASDKGSGESDSTASKPKREKKPKKEKVTTTEDTGIGGNARHGPSAYVARVIDGDTIEVVLRGRTIDIRLIGIDTPETVHPTEPVECFGPKASEFTTSRLSDRNVQLDFDAERKDQYGRTLAYIWVGNQLFNKTLVAGGFASVTIYEPNDEYASRLYTAESFAESHDRGMWGACSVSSDGDTQAIGGDSGSGSGGSKSGGSGAGNCDPNYEGACIPPYPPDLDCTEISASGFRSVGSDPHGFDGDGDGIACE